LPEEQRKFVAKNKFLLDGNDLKGKKIIVVDDSIIRGTISFEICKLLQEANTSEIHICSSLPPVVNICDL
jgi:amidophosphoribosyltransferase